MIETGVSMKTKFRTASSTMPPRAALLAALGMALAVVPAMPQVAHAQVAGETTEARLRRLEAEIRALQRKVFPDGAGRTFGPEITATPSTTAPATPPAATSPLTDVLARLDAVEAQLRQVTAASEENQNHLSKLDSRVSALETAASPPAAPAGEPASASAATPPRPVAPGGAAGKAPTVTPTVSATPAPVPAKPSADRVAAVAAIEKPSTSDKQADEYTYGYRLYDAGFFPEAQVQLNKFVTTYPKSKQISLARNLLGRAYLDDGKPGTAAQWFLQNYLGDKKGDRAPDSLLYLGVAMTRINDTKRACGAFAELRDAYPSEIAGRLKGAYDTAIKGVKCD
jgi:TolA-binding protein